MEARLSEIRRALIPLTDAYIIRPTSETRNENEYYPTPPIATLCLLKNSDVPSRIWEPAAGRGHISRELERNGRHVVSTDLYGYPDTLVPVVPGVDFLTADRPDGVDGVITNPPFKSNLPEKLIRRVLVDHGFKYLALFCRLTFMESARRHGLFKEMPPSLVLAFSQRIQCNEKYFDQKDGIGGMVAYAWFVWDRRDGKTEHGDTRLSWVLPSDYIGDLG